MDRIKEKAKSFIQRRIDESEVHLKELEKGENNSFSYWMEYQAEYCVHWETTKDTWIKLKNTLDKDKIADKEVINWLKQVKGSMIDNIINKRTSKSTNPMTNVISNIKLDAAKHIIGDIIGNTSLTRLIEDLEDLATHPPQ